MDDRSVDAWIRLVAIVGAAVLVVAGLFAAVTSDPAPGLEVPAILGAAVALSVVVPIRYRYREQTHGLTLDQAVAVALLLAVPAAWVPLTLTAAATLGHLVRRTEPRKSLFNAGIVAVSSGAAAATFTGVTGAGQAPGLTGRSILACVLAQLVMEVVAQAIMGELFRRFGRGQARDVVKGLSSVQRFTLPGGLALGLILGWLAAEGPAGAVAGALIIAVLFLAYRAMVGVEQQRRRVQHLREVSSALVEASRSLDAFDQALAATARLFSARQAELLLSRPPMHRVVLADGTYVVGAEVSAAAEAVADGVHKVAGGVLVARLRRRDRDVGVLVLHEPEGLEPWDDADADVLAGLADEVLVALENAELVEALAAERAELVSQSALLSGILDGASDGIALIGDDGRVLSWNPAMAAIVGVPVSVARGEALADLMLLEDEAGGALAIDLPPGHTLTPGVPSARTWRVRRPHGEVRYVRALLTRARAGGADGIVIVARDITAIRQVERLKADFVTTVSHELRTPLTPIGGNLELLLRHGDQLPPDRREAMLQSMQRQVGRLSQLVDDLTAVAEIDRDLGDLDSVDVDLDAVASEVVADAPPGRVELHLGGDVHAKGDRDAIVRVAHALVANALQHTTGRIRVRTSWTRSQAILAVEDEGAGIADTDKESIFEQFHRLGSIDNHQRGAGLGLPIARALARRLGGDVRVASTVGIGSVFTLLLPTGVARLPATGDVERVASSWGSSAADGDPADDAVALAPGQVVGSRHGRGPAGAGRT